MEAATKSVIERFPIRRRYTIPCFAKQCTRTVSRDNGYDNWGYMEEAFADDVRIMTSVPLDSLEYTSLRALTPMRYFSHRFPPRCVQNGSSWNSATRRKRGLISSGCKISKERKVAYLGTAQENEYPRWYNEKTTSPRNSSSFEIYTLPWGICKFHARITRGLLSRGRGRGRIKEQHPVFHRARRVRRERGRERGTLFGTSNFSKKFTGIETRKIARYILKTSLER